MFLPFVNNGSHCGSLESQSFRNGFITFSRLIDLNYFLSHLFLNFFGSLHDCTEIKNKQTCTQHTDRHVNLTAYFVRFPWVNYLDTNLNISIPVFSVHGNHDDPTGCQLAVRKVERPFRKEMSLVTECKLGSLRGEQDYTFMHIGLLRVKGKKINLQKIPLQTVRQFFIQDVTLSEHPDLFRPEQPNVMLKVMAFCQEKVEEMLEEAERQRLGNPLTPEKPLIRLRVDYSGGFEVFNTMRFSQKFYLSLCYVCSAEECMDFEALLSRPTSEVLLLRVEDLVKEYFQTAEKNVQLSLLTEQGMGKAVQEFVDKEEKDIRQFRDSKRNTAEEDEEVQEAIIHDDLNLSDEPADIAVESDEESTSAPTICGRGRGSRGASKRGRARGAASKSGRGGHGQKGSLSSALTTKRIWCDFCCHMSS
uniref:MRE11 homolog A, double strand break repair nuclease n=1 Tax=Sinocyclocheilus anshuiensis TaxID=1608454 RepID=A0A671M3H4_9TELE